VDARGQDGVPAGFLRSLSRVDLLDKRDRKTHVRSFAGCIATLEKLLFRGQACFGECYQWGYWTCLTSVEGLLCSPGSSSLPLSVRVPQRAIDKGDRTLKITEPNRSYGQKTKEKQECGAAGREGATPVGEKSSVEIVSSSGVGKSDTEPRIGSGDGCDPTEAADASLATGTDQTIAAILDSVPYRKYWISALLRRSLILLRPRNLVGHNNYDPYARTF